MPFSQKGKDFFGNGMQLATRWLRPNEVIEDSIYLEELFVMQASREYTVLVSLPVVGDVDAVLTAAPVKVKIAAAPAAPIK